MVVPTPEMEDYLPQTANPSSKSVKQTNKQTDFSLKDNSKSFSHFSHSTDYPTDNLLEIESLY